MSNELRTLFVDSAQAERQSDGSFRIILREQMEVDIENVLYLDDLSVCGQLPMVSNHSSKVYCIEQTPKSFDFLTNFLLLISSITAIPAAQDKGFAE